MSSLKDYRDRITSVKSTRKITSAMKMVAASKLRKAQEAAENNIAYAQAMEDMTTRVVKSSGQESYANPLLSGTGKNKSYLLIVITASRGLCAGFNSNIIRQVRPFISNLRKEHKHFRILCIGRKGYDMLRREFAEHMMDMYSFKEMKEDNEVTYGSIEIITENVISMYNEGDFDICTVFYNKFNNILSQAPEEFQLIPVDIKLDKDNRPIVGNTGTEKLEIIKTEASKIGIEGKNHFPQTFSASEIFPYCEYEPDENTLLENLLPINACVQLYQAVLDSAAGEQAARMTAMDNATNSAGDMIDDLTLQYNRERQSVITNELIEIISGAEAT